MTSFWKYKVHADIRGGSLGRGCQSGQMTLGVVDDCYFGDLGGYVFENFRDMATPWLQNEWPWMSFWTGFWVERSQKCVTNLSLLKHDQILASTVPSQENIVVL